MKKLLVALLCILSLTTTSFAQKYILVNFNFLCNGAHIDPSKHYTNAFGTKYQISDVECFVSNIEIRVNGKWITNATQIRIENPDNKKTYSEPYYLDNDWLQNYFSFSIKSKQPVVDSIRFTFGIPKELNKSYSLEDPELARMYWPEILGGGYHYMKLNIKFIDNQDSVSLFNCHLGRGVVGDTFIDNDFTVTLPVSQPVYMFEKPLTAKQWHKMTDKYLIYVNMNIEKWFTEPNPIDFNLYTKGIMGNQEVMGKILENGKNVFSTSPLMSLYIYHSMMMR